MKKYGSYLIFVLFIIVLDQASKWAIVEILDNRSVIDIALFLKLILVYNSGAAFGFLDDAGGFQHYLFSLIAVGVSLVLLVWIWRIYQQKVMLTFALCFILAGALGNLIDRLRLGYVVDFINLHYQDWYFPAFNVADMSITVGAMLLLWNSFFENGKS